MNHKELVLRCYPTAKCWKPSDDFFVPNDPRNGDIMIYYVIPGYLQLLSNHFHNEDQAWEDAWCRIQQKMLKQLET